MQPTLELRHFGGQPSIDELRKKIVCGLEQVIRQGQSMQQGGWADEGLPPAPFVSVLISYGQFYAVRLPWFRERIRKALDEKGLGNHPFAVLSINEFDAVVRLAELGFPMDKFFLPASQEIGPAGLIRSQGTTFAGKIVASSYAHRRSQDLESRFFPSISSTNRNTANGVRKRQKPANSSRRR